MSSKGKKTRKSSANVTKKKEIKKNWPRKKYKNNIKQNLVHLL